MRERLADDERTLAERGASGAQRAAIEPLTARRRALSAQLKALPDAQVAFGKRIELARGNFDQLDQQAAEIMVAIDTTQATVIAT
jgi:hypothetical protein